LPGSARGVLPFKGDAIEVLWTEVDKDDEWFTVEVILPDVAWISYRPGKRSASGI
jgi:hypothetical protein